MHRALQVEVLDHSQQVVGIVVHVVAVRDLGRAAMATAVMRDHPIAVIEEEHHLRVPVVGRQRPAMAEHDGLTRAPVLVVDLDAVLRRDIALMRARRRRFRRRFRRGPGLRGGDRDGRRDADAGQQIAARCRRRLRIGHSIFPLENSVDGSCRRRERRRQVHYMLSGTCHDSKRKRAPTNLMRRAFCGLCS